MRDKSPEQIMRLDGKNVFLEVMKSAFHIGKVQINFIEYDPAKNNQQTKNIPLYIDMDKFLVLAQDIISGRISSLGKTEKGEVEKRKAEATKQGKETKYIYANAVHTDMGGIPSESLKRRKAAHEAKNPGKPLFNFVIPEGKCLSRQFKITPGDSKPWILSGEQGIGDDNNDTHLIVPCGSEAGKGYKPMEIVRIPIGNDDDLKRFALFVKAHIDGYLAASYTEYFKYNPPKPPKQIGN